jgi:DNA invertase Pin-like site-specific DNA recombinase
MPAYAYLRKSSVRDPAREVSHEIQERAVRELAARYGDDNGALVLLSDWDKSGRLGADKRPGYRALLEAIDAGRATALYSYSLSRLARSVPELSRLVALCNAKDIPVRLYADHVDTATASGRLLTHVLASVAEFEADVASERVRAAIAAKVARGESIGTVHRYGEREGEDAEAVLAAFREAGSYSGAARLLNARGIKPRGSKRGWWPSAVAPIVRRLDPSLPVPERVQGAKAGGVSFVLAHLLRCPSCGTKLTGLRDRGGRRVRYVCRLGSVTPHPRMSITEGHILPAVQAEVAHLHTPELVEQVERDKAAAIALEARRARILDMYERGDIDRAEYMKRLAAVTEELAALDAKRVVLAVPAIDWTWPPKQLNGVLCALFEEIALDPNTFQPARYMWRVPEWRAQDEAAASGSAGRRR